MHFCFPDKQVDSSMVMAVHPHSFVEVYNPAQQCSIEVEVEPTNDEVIQYQVKKSSNINVKKIKETTVYPSTNMKQKRKRRFLDAYIREQLELEFRMKQRPNLDELQRIAGAYQIEKKNSTKMVH